MVVAVDDKFLDARVGGSLNVVGEQIEAIAEGGATLWAKD